MQKKLYFKNDNCLTQSCKCPILWKQLITVMLLSNTVKYLITVMWLPNIVKTAYQCHVIVTTLNQISDQRYATMGLHLHLSRDNRRVVCHCEFTVISHMVINVTVKTILIFNFFILPIHTELTVIWQIFTEYFWQTFF